MKPKKAVKDRILDHTSEASVILPELASFADSTLVLLRARLDSEMRRRKIALSVGGVGERLTIGFFNANPSLPKLQAAPPGTKNADALSRDGERYSIKTVCHAKKTGTIYPATDDRDRQLFEYVLIVQLSEDWTLKSIHQLSWKAFAKVRSWDKRMNAWYLAVSARTLAAGSSLYENHGDAT